MGSYRLNDLLTQGPTVKGRGPVLGNHPVGVGQVGVPEPLSGLRGPGSVQEECGRGSGILFQDSYVAPPLAGDDGGYGKPILSDFDSRGQSLGQGEGPVFVEEGGPSRQGSRDGDGLGPPIRYVIQPKSPDRIGSGQ